MQMFVSCVHHVAVVDAGRGCKRQPYGRGILQSWSHNCLVCNNECLLKFCLPHPVAVSVFMICRGLCACTETLWMYVLYASVGSKVKEEPLVALPWVVHCCVF